ncbi:hypothetical protein KTD26_20605 [Burkholderia multivorans]|uniref:hypothetical protein n=2 Tax=Burkholderia multivorans TaxID=87883 RepID=UPI001C2236A0|nr:hypothetical protein [Burkholderia multivorans]MBU9144923.1 hypothetical protein [Burkholderia multivorans]MBU9528245.1 hypothetical protein [Burkholderia multivorans]MBU9537150.1 hypothetical protein [Burkholderia multivorans]
MSEPKELCRMLKIKTVDGALYAYSDSRFSWYHTKHTIVVCGRSHAFLRVFQLGNIIFTDGK